MTSVLVVEPQAPERCAIVDALASIDNVAVLGAVPGVKSALHALAGARPDVIVTAIELIDGNGIEVVDAARRHADPPTIVVIDRDPTREAWRRHLAAGADRVVDRDRDLSELKYIVRMLAQASRRCDPRSAAPRRVELARLVVDALAEAPRWVARGVGIHIEMQSGETPIFGVLDELADLVRMLVRDATAAARPGGEVWIRVRRTRARASLLELAVHRAYGDAIRDAAPLYHLARRQHAALKIASRDDGWTTMSVLFPADVESA